ncbi:MAG: GAF domain-containing protein [Anaerolineae bacterium]|jgi:GAF domain-containing protein/HAMP domain-containing protein|nr:GAF domain-containing protein [Anaerolineae bacterium]MBT7192250.1 GAF domain-containing protein [Anaerolineae bacterium]MBT7990907.1 GAF domain-containing protein [Anaerolineae bacterium]
MMPTLLSPIDYQSLFWVLALALFTIGLFVLVNNKTTQNRLLGFTFWSFALNSFSAGLLVTESSSRGATLPVILIWLTMISMQPLLALTSLSLLGEKLLLDNSRVKFFRGLLGLLFFLPITITLVDLLFNTNLLFSGLASDYNGGFIAQSGYIRGVLTFPVRLLSLYIPAGIHFFLLLGLSLYKKAVSPTRKKILSALLFSQILFLLINVLAPRLNIVTATFILGITATVIYAYVGFVYLMGSQSRRGESISRRLHFSTMLILFPLVIGSALIFGERSAKIAQLGLETNFISMSITVVLIIGTFAVALGLLSLAFNQSLAPLKEIDEGVQALMDKNYQYQIEQHGEDEISSLTGSFNRALQSVDVSTKDLERQITFHSMEANRQSKELLSITKITRLVLGTTDVSSLLNKVVDLISEEFGFYHTGIFLLDEKKEIAILQAASSSGGEKMLTRGHQLRVGSEGIVGAAAEEKRPRIALDVGADAVFFNNPDLPETRSEIALPLLFQDEVIGVLDIQSVDAEAFIHQDIETFQNIADQLALAAQNVRLLEEAKISIAQLNIIAAEDARSTWQSYLDRQSHGFLYTPLGIKPLSAEQKNREKEADQRADVPITLRGKRIGDITMQRVSRQWTNKEKTLLADVATQVGLAIENARLLNETREQATQEQLISEVSSRLRETLDMDTVLKTAMEEIKRTFSLKEVEVRLVTPKEENKVNN